MTRGAGAVVRIGSADGGWGEVRIFDGPFSRVVVRGLGGDDDLWAVGPGSVPVWLYGDDGADRLLGGGPGVLVGGAGEILQPKNFLQGKKLSWSWKQ